MDCEYAKKERECLKLSECGLKGMIYELGLGELNHKQSDKKIRNFRGFFGLSILRCWNFLRRWNVMFMGKCI